MKIATLIALILIISSCDRKPAETSQIRTIDLLSEPESEIENLSDISSDIEYISLQTTEGSLIRYIRKVVICKNKIYIQNNIDGVMCFTREGRFLYKLDKTGRGPGEYNYLTDFDISSDGKTLAILTSGSARIMLFDNTETEFVLKKVINLRQPVPLLLNIVPETTNIMLSTAPWEGNEFSLSMLININGDTLFFRPNFYKYEFVGNNRFVATNESIQYRADNEICFKEEFSDTIFSVNNKSTVFLPKFIFNSHGTSFPPRARGDQEYAKSIAGESSQILSIMEVPRYMFYYFVFKGTTHKIIYDKSTDKKFEIKTKKAFSDNILGGPRLDFRGTSEDKFYSSIEAIELKSYVSSKEFDTSEVKDPEGKENLKMLANSLKETDNPVLIIVTPKK